MRGRKPKPVSQQIAEGDPRKHGVNKLQERLAAEPKAARGLPTCPRHLRGRARSAWGFWSAELEAMKLDRRPDAMMLEGACLAYEASIRAVEQCRNTGGDVIEEPILVKSKQTGEDELVGHRLKRNPWVSIRERSLLILKAFCSEFGLSPVSRTRLTVEKPDDIEADFMALLSKPRESSKGARVQ